MSNLTLNVSGVASTGRVGQPGAPIQGALSLSLPVPQLAAGAAQGNYGTVALTLPVPTLAITARASARGAIALTLPTPQLAATGRTGVAGSVALTLPVPVVAASAPNAVALALPVPQLAATGRVGPVGSVALTLPTPQLAVQVAVPYVGNVALGLPVPQLAVSASLGNAGATKLYLTKLAVAVEGMTGVVGSVTLALPLVALNAAGYQPVIGVVTLDMPMLRLATVGGPAGANAAQTVVMHTETQALSTYSNFPYNSFAAFNGVYLAASNAGLFALGGDTDNGALIQAAARVGMSDLSSSHLKRVDRIYVGYQTDGDMVLRVFTDGAVERDYALRSNNFAGMHGNHARLGKGLMSRYWQFEVRNLNGASFTMDTVELKPTELTRRIGGPDA